MRASILPRHFGKAAITRPMATLAAAGIIALLAYLVLHGAASHAAEAEATRPASGAALAADSVELKPSQLAAVRIEAIGAHEFRYRRPAVGIIDFDQNLNVQVFTPYQGRILDTYADLGDAVKKGQVLFTIESPDFIAAESALIGAAATLEQTASALQRATKLYAAHGIDQNDYEAAVASQQSAEGALKAARAAVAVFGKTAAEIDRIIARRQVEPALMVRSPLTGHITARNAAPGALEQPGNAPAPYAVADLATKWMVANVSESDGPLLKVGQPIRATVSALPGRSFEGSIVRLGRSLDPSTHRIQARGEIEDPKDELIPGMLASFAIQVQDPVTSIAIPVNGVVRNGDGSFAAWVTTDRRRFTQRLVKLGEPLDGEYPVLAGLKRGELAITDGAVFVSNLLYAPPTD
jgi:cobalt-zinc-cadmium efflux system membrane fusion protein